MGTWSLRRDGKRVRGGVWDDHGPSFFFFFDLSFQGFDCGSIVVIPVQDSENPRLR